VNEKTNPKCYLIEIEDSQPIVNNQNMPRKKRALNGQPLNLFVEYLVVVDNTVFTKYQNLYKLDDTRLVLQYLKIHYSHIVNAVCFLKN
jgi:hypothetical protein